MRPGEDDINPNASMVSDICLIRISTALGCTLAGFFTSRNGLVYTVALVELIRLWPAIKRETDQKHLLEMARQLAGQ